MGWNAPSEEELEAQGGDYDTLPEDEYIAKVVGIELKPNQVNKYPTPRDNAPFHDMIIVKAEAISFANGDKLVDVNEEELDGPVPFQAWLNPAKTGMIPRPSNTRKFFAAVLGQPVGDPISIPDFSELLGKQFIVSLKPNGSYNNPQDYRSIRRSRSRGTTSKGPVDGGELVTRVKEIFDEDSSTNTSPNPEAGKEDDLDF